MNVESKTTTVGLTLRDYVVLAADKRATAGPAVYHKAVKKIAKITDRAAMTISGLVADAQILVDNMRYIVREYELSTGRPMSIRAMASNLSLILCLDRRETGRALPAGGAGRLRGSCPQYERNGAARLLVYRLSWWATPGSHAAGGNR